MPHARFHSRQGAALVIITTFVVALFGFAALSLDIGAVQLQRKRAQEGVDAAALAAVKDWARGLGSAAAIQVGYDFAAANGLLTNEIESIETGTWTDASKTFNGPLTTLPANTVPAVRVVARRSVNTPFWRVVSFGVGTQMRPRVEAVAIVGQPLAATGVLPWATCDSLAPSKCDPLTLQIKDGGETNACLGSGPRSGNFGQLTLPGGCGASWYEQNIAEGYQGVLRVGQCVDTDPGVSWGPTKQGIDARIKGLPAYNCTSSSAAPDNKRLALVPKVVDLDVSGKKQVCITGFYVVILDGYNNSSKTVNARFFEAFGGTEVNLSAPPIPGELAGVALVR